MYSPHPVGTLSFLHLLKGQCGHVPTHDATRSPFRVSLSCRSAFVVILNETIMSVALPGHG